LVGWLVGACSTGGSYLLSDTLVSDASIASLLTPTPQSNVQPNTLSVIGINDLVAPRLNGAVRLSASAINTTEADVIVFITLNVTDAGGNGVSNVGTPSGVAAITFTGTLPLPLPLRLCLCSLLC